MVLDEILSKGYGLGSGYAYSLRRILVKILCGKALVLLLFQVNEESNMNELLLKLRIY